MLCSDRSESDESILFVTWRELLPVFRLLRMPRDRSMLFPAPFPFESVRAELSLIEVMLPQAGFIAFVLLVLVYLLWMRHHGWRSGTVVE